MELVINKTKIKGVPIREFRPETFTPGGILNSPYKEVAKANTKNRSESLHSIKQSSKTRAYKMTNVAATVVKLSLFLTLLGFLF